MPTKSDIIRLRHMLEAADKAKAFTGGKARQDLDRDEKLALALVRLIEIIGEAAATEDRPPQRDRNGPGNTLEIEPLRVVLALPILDTLDPILYYSA
jgi:hypothetical protein